MFNQKGFSKTAIIIIVLILIGGAYFVFNKKEKNVPSKTTKNQSNQSSQSIGGELSMSDWKTYKIANDQFGFEIKYPPVWHEIGLGPGEGNLPGSSLEFQTDQSANEPKNRLYGPVITVFVSNFYIKYKKVTKDEFITEVTRAQDYSQGKFASVNYKWVNINNSKTNYIDALRVERKVESKSINLNRTSVSYFIFKGDKVYKLEFSHDDNNSTLTQYLEQFETMVSTFNFVY